MFHVKAIKIQKIESILPRLLLNKAGINGIVYIECHTWQKIMKITIKTYPPRYADGYSPLRHLPLTEAIDIRGVLKPHSAVGGVNPVLPHPTSRNKQESHQ